MAVGFPALIILFLLSACLLQFKAFKIRKKYNLSLAKWNKVVPSRQGDKAATDAITSTSQVIVSSPATDNAISGPEVEGADTTPPVVRSYTARPPTPRSGPVNNRFSRGTRFESDAIYPSPPSPGHIFAPPGTSELVTGEGRARYRCAIHKKWVDPITGNCKYILGPTPNLHIQGAANKMTRSGFGNGST